MASFSVFSAEKSPGVFIIFPEGNLDSNTHFMLEEKIDGLLLKQPSAIVFDMQKLDYISSMGVRTIAKTAKDLEEKGGQIRLLNLKPPIQKVFDIIQALPPQQIFSSIQEMDEYLDAMQKQTSE